MTAHATWTCLYIDPCWILLNKDMIHFPINVSTSQLLSGYACVFPHTSERRLGFKIFPWYLELPINFISTMVLVLDLLRQMEKWIHLGSKVKQQKIKVGVPIGTFTYATTPSYLDRKRWSSGIELLLEEVCAAEDQTWTYTFVHMLGNGIISDWQPLFKNIHCYLILCICSTQISLLLWHHYEICYKWPRSASYNNIVVLIHHYKGFIMGKLLYHGKIL